MCEKLVLGPNLRLCSQSKKKKKSEMLIKLIVQDMTEVIGNCIFNFTAGTCILTFFFFSFPCFIMRGWLVGLVLSPVRFVSQIYLLIKCGAITDPFLTAIRHRIVWMRPQLLHILLSQTKPHLQILGGVPKEKSNFNFLSVTYNSPISLLSSMSFTRVLQCCQHRVMF